MKSGTPILLCLVPGYDASGRYDDRCYFPPTCLINFFVAIATIEFLCESSLQC